MKTEPVGDSSYSRMTRRFLDRVEVIAPIVKARAGDADKVRRLTDDVVDALHGAGLYRMMVPVDYGGGGLSTREALPVIEAVAALNGSVGWNLNIGATSLSVFAGIEDGDARAHVFGDGSALVAGGVDPLGVRVTRVDGGYEFDGRAPFASGSTHATWLMAAGFLREGAAPSQGDTPPVLLAGVFPPEDATIVDTWHVSGLRATGSNDILLDNLFVPEAYTLRLGAAIPGHHDPLAALPLLSRLGSGLAAVALGIASHALESTCDLTVDGRHFGSAEPLHDRPDVGRDVAHAVALIESGGAYLSAVLSATEAVVRNQQPFGPRHLARLRLAYITAAGNARAATDVLFHAAGSTALFERAELERCWRDVNAVTHHAAVSARHLERIGRIQLGLPPGPGPI